MRAPKSPHGDGGRSAATAAAVTRARQAVVEALWLFDFELRLTDARQYKAVVEALWPLDFELRLTNARQYKECNFWLTYDRQVPIGLVSARILAVERNVWKVKIF